MKTTMLCALFVAALFLSGCVTAPFVPPMGSIFTMIDAPLDLDVNKTEVCEKEGEASCVCILGLVSIGDCSVQTAAKEGGLSVINHADYDYMNVLGIFQQTTVRVFGN